MILVDTNTWVHHLRSGDSRLVALLHQNRVVTSDVVIGELLLGAGLPASFLRLLDALPRVASPTAAQTRDFIDRHRRAFRGSGVGWADAQIILAAVSAGALMHSSDGAVRSVWRKLGFGLA